jgi:hypothetical protein
MARQLENRTDSGIEREVSKEAKQFADRIMEDLKGWAPERFAEELYNDPEISTDYLLVIRKYLSDHPELKAKVETYREKYQKLKD